MESSLVPIRHWCLYAILPYNTNILCLLPGGSPSWSRKHRVNEIFFSSLPYDPPSTYTIIAGTIHRDSHSTTDQIRTATEVIIHEGYDDDIYINDIALLRVSPLTITDAVRTICIPNSDAAVGTACTISGWGNTSSDSSRKRICSRAHENLAWMYDHANRFLWDVITHPCPQLQQRFK